MSQDKIDVVVKKISETLPDGKAHLGLASQQSVSTEEWLDIFTMAAKSLLMPITWVPSPITFSSQRKFLAAVKSAVEKDAGKRLVVVDMSKHDKMPWKQVNMNTFGTALSHLFKAHPDLIYMQIIKGAILGADSDDVVIRSLQPHPQSAAPKLAP